MTEFVIRFDGPADLWLDDLMLVPGTGPSPAIAGLAALAFSGAVARIHRSAAVDILTDVPELELERLAAHLADVQAAVRADLAFLPETVAPPLLVVTSSREAQLRLVRQLAAAVRAETPPPPAGYTLLGIATATWDPELGSLRPVFTHEYVHSMLDRLRVLPNAPNDWLNEGLATHYQLRFHPESAPSDPRLDPDLTAILDGADVENRGGGYLRAAATVDLLLHDARYAPSLPALFEALAASGSNALRPHLGPVLGVDEARFAADWLQWTDDR